MKMKYWATAEEVLEQSPQEKEFYLNDIVSFYAVDHLLEEKIVQKSIGHGQVKQKLKRIKHIPPCPCTVVVLRNGDEYLIAMTYEEMAKEIEAMNKKWEAING